MLIRIFVNANTDSCAIKIYKNLIDITKTYIENENINKVEKYWKYENMFVVESDILLNCEINSDRFKNFLCKISDKWQFFGIPINEALASSTTEGCKYIIDKVEMINIFY